MDSEPMYYDRSGARIDMWEWALLQEDLIYRIVQQDEVGDTLVSTVWLGLNHNWLRQGQPLIFETMVFGSEEDDAPQWRWSTEQQAIAGHAEVCSAYLRARQPHRKGTQ